MSDATAADLDLREQIGRIDRQRAETDKLSMEVRKLNAEANKLNAEAMKFQRDRGLAPWLAGGAVVGGVVTLAGVVLKALGLGL